MSVFYQPLADVVGATAYRPCWEIIVDPDCIRGDWRGPALVIRAYTQDTYSPDRTLRVNHPFPLPPVDWDRETWTHWLFDRLLDVEAHEAMEFFTVDGQRPFSPSHGGGGDPYRRTYGRPMR